MKELVTPAFAALAAIVCVTGIAATDLTSSMELVCNPAQSRWPSSAKSRHVQDLVPYKGKIYTSGGEWDGNTGPCPCFAVDPKTNAYTNEFSAGTDAIYEFKEFSDGLLYASAVDPHEGSSYVGHTFRRAADGRWQAFKTCVTGSLTNTSGGVYYTHNWDMAEYKGKVFVCGYGISGSTNRCETKMFDATAGLRDSKRHLPGASWTNPGGTDYNMPFGYTVPRRFCTFLPFDNDIFCITMHPAAYQKPTCWDIWEEWRWNDSQNRFNCQTNTWANIAPGVTHAMMDLFTFTTGVQTLQLWHPTKFKGRILYILGGHTCNITPVAGFSAVNDNHKIKATRLNLGSESVKPFDIFATSDAVYLTAAQAGATATTVTNSVWKSTDGVNFTQLFTFRSSRQASAICYYDGCFYLGMGSNADTKDGWPKVTGTEVAGNIYRIRYTQTTTSSASTSTKTTASPYGDYTSSLELLGNPSSQRWGSNKDRMGVTDLFFYQNKLFVSGGATELNAGPCPLQQIDPATKTITVEGSAGTENISVFKQFSDGRLYVPSQDPRDYDSNYSDDGHVFVRNAKGEWKFYKNVPKGSAKDKNGSITEAYVHNWDMEEFKGRIFVGGYGISFTKDGCASWTSATPHWTSSLMAYYYPTDVWDYKKKEWKVSPASNGNNTTFRRELQFMKFNDRLLAIPYQYVASGVPKQYYDSMIEVHRFNEKTERFEQMTNRCSRVFPNLSTNDFKMVRSKNEYTAPYSNDQLKLWHTTPFSNRVFYVVSPYDTYTNQWGSARKGYHETQYPYPMFACAADPTSDGLFTSTRLDFGTEEYPFDFLVKGPVMYALTVHYNASNKQVRHTVWRTRNAKNFEKLFTFNFHQYLISMEYQDGKFYFGAGYKGASQAVYELDNTTDAAGNVYRIAFNPGDASDSGSSSPSPSPDPDPGSSTGSGDTSTPAPSGLVDLTKPTGTFEAPKGAVAMKPFNDNTNASQTTDRVCIQSTNFSIIYDFTTATLVNAYRIYNLGVYNPSTRPPKDWKFYGSNDKSSWTLLDTRTNETGWKSAEARYYTFTNATKYRYYKLAITANNGDSYTQFLRLEYYAVGTSATTPTPHEPTPSDLVDLTKPTGTFEAPKGAVAMKPFNDNTNASQTTDRVCIQSTNFSIIYDFTTATLVNAYRIYNLGVYNPSTRPPKDWKFYGSNDKSSWTLLDTRTNEKDWKAAEARYYDFSNATKYRYYKLAITANNGDSYTQFLRLEYYAVGTTSASTSGRVDLTKPTGTFEAPTGAVAMKPFNDNTNAIQTTDRVCIQSTNFSITYDFTTATLVNAYQIYNLGVYNPTTRPPKSWKFYGSNDKSNWTLLDTRTNETGWKSAEARYYAFTNTSKYRYYKLAITANNGDSYTQFLRLEYYAVGTSTTTNSAQAKLSSVAEPVAETLSVSALEPVAEVKLSASLEMRSRSGLRLMSADEPAAERQALVIAVDSVTEGLYYTLLTTESLGVPFKAAACVRATAEDAAGGLVFELPTDGKRALFAKVVVSTEPNTAE